MNLERTGRRRRRICEVDVMLIHVDSFYNTLYSYFNMGLLYIGTYLKEHGYNSECMGINDLMNLSHQNLGKIFRTTRPAIVGFYTLSDNINQVLNFASQIKKWSPRSNIVVGGPLATSIGADMLQYSQIDMCIVGEGEIPVKMLADYIIYAEGSLNEIPGLIYRFKGDIVSNLPAPPIKDLDVLPFPDHSLAGTPKSFHVVSGRGCPYNCIFCFQGVHGLKYRYRSADNIVEEIGMNLKRYKARAFDIIDDTFISNPQRVKEIAKKLKELHNSTGIDFRFFCQGRVDIMDKHPEMLEYLKEAGLCRVQVGIESGHPDILKLYEKKITVEQIKRVVKRAADIGEIVVIGNFILGGPFENEETFGATMNLAKELVEIAPGAFEAGASYLGPYPGTRIAANPEKYGLKVYDDRFRKGLTLSDCHLTTETFDVNGIRQLFPRFRDTVLKAMKKNLHRIPYKLLNAHYEWATRFWTFSNWYQVFLKEKQSLEHYFMYLDSPRFRTLDRIPPEDILNWYPQRTSENRSYSKDGRQLILPETTVKARLYKPEEILVYELSAGKLTMKQVIDEFRAERHDNRPDSEILEYTFIPVFKKLESLYQVVFYK